MSSAESQAQARDNYPNGQDLHGDELLDVVPAAESDDETVDGDPGMPGGNTAAPCLEDDNEKEKEVDADEAGILNGVSNRTMESGSAVVDVEKMGNDQLENIHHTGQLNNTMTELRGAIEDMIRRMTEQWKLETDKTTDKIIDRWAATDEKIDKLTMLLAKVEKEKDALVKEKAAIAQECQEKDDIIAGLNTRIEELEARVNVLETQEPEQPSPSPPPWHRSINCGPC